jgi:NTE family protein
MLESMAQGRSVAIACQGGGSHTAFSAGVLAELLAAAELATTPIVGISGTSGGAICATLVWSALRDGDRARAGKALEEFWADNAAEEPVDRVLNAATLLAGLAQGYGMLPAISPYQLPMPSYGLDRFREMLERHIDFDMIDVDVDARHPMLLLGAVDVRSGRFRAFNSREDRITADCVLASAAIPMLFPAVHVNGGAYWDGLFSQNPPVRNLLDTAPDELWVIQVNPTARDDEPTTVLDIADRRNELAGNLSLYQELSFVEKVDQLLEDGMLSRDGKYKQVVVRIIEMPSDVARLPGPASKLNRDPAFLAELIACGRRQAQVFLSGHAFERSWMAGDVDRVLGHFTDDADIIVRDRFGSTTVARGATARREFVTTQLRDAIRVDPVRKQITGDRVRWSVRTDHDDGSVVGTAELVVGPTGVSELRLHPG